MTYDQKPWLKSYDSGVSENVDVPDITLTEYFLTTFSRFKDRTAFNYLGMSMTFEELLEQSGKFAKVLKDQGLGKGDVVAICLPNTPQYIISVVGALRAGCAISGLAPLFMPDEIAYQLNDCNARVLVILDMIFDAKLAGVADQVPNLEQVFVTGVFDYLPNTESLPEGKPLAGKTVGAFKTIVEQADNQPPEVSIGVEDACYLQYTGGTTGKPKGAFISHGNIVSNIQQYDEWVKLEKGTGYWLSGFPMFHMAGLFVCTCALGWGFTQSLIPDPRNVQHIIGEFKQHQITGMINVPSLYQLLLAEEDFRSLDFSRLQYAWSGAAPLPVELLKQLNTVFGAGKLIELWGMTETSPVITMNPAKGAKKTGSVGLPLPSTKFRIISLDDHVTDVPLGEDGELVCSGPQVMLRYLNKPEETAKTLRELDSDLWMFTGDVGHMDKDGYIYIVDRAKDMLIVGGYKVFSSDVEDKLFKHPAIESCAIVGEPHPERPDSQIVKLMVQKSPEFADKPDDEVRASIKQFAKEALAPYKVPKKIEFIGEIPLTSVGKINKKAMR